MNRRLTSDADAVSLERTSRGMTYTHISLEPKELVQLLVTLENTRSGRERESIER